MNHHFQKEKLLYLLANCMDCIFYVFHSTKLFLYFTSKLCRRRTPHTGHTGLFFSTCFLVQNCIHEFGCFVRSLVEEVCFLELNFSVMDNGSERENFAHKMALT